MATCLAEVQIRIWQVETLRVDETFKQKTVTDRVDVGYAYAPCHQRASGGTTTRPDRNASFTAVIHQIAYHQEVTTKSQASKRVHFVLKSLNINPVLRSRWCVSKLFCGKTFTQPCNSQFHQRCRFVVCHLGQCWWQFMPAPCAGIDNGVLRC